MRIAHNVILNRYPLDNNSDSVGTVVQWEKPIHDIYAQMPFPSLFSGLTVEAIHRDTPQGAELKNRNAAGLAWSGGLRLIQFSVHENRTPEQAVLTLSHEFGHFYQFECRLKLDSSETDQITALIAEQWNTLRPFQTQATKEDWAEVCRAVFGADAVRGTYSDGKRASISTELRSLVRCAYWLSLVLKGLHVYKIKPTASGVQYCAWLNNGWRWRWISQTDFQSKEWNGKEWIAI